MTQLQALCFYRTDSRSKHIARAMAEGIRSCGDIAIELAMHKYMRRPSGHVAVFYGYKGTGKEIMQDYLAAGLKTVFFDLGYWCRRMPGGGRSQAERLEGYHRLAVNGRHAMSTVLDRDWPVSRLDALRVNPALESETDLRVQPRNKRGKYILLAGMQMKSCASYDLDYMQWEKAALARLRNATHRQILYRPKPKDDMAEPLAGTLFSPRTQRLQDILPDVWAVVTHHSNVAVNALINGVPVHCADGVAKPLSEPEIENIDNPYFPPDDLREKWMRNIAWWQWSVAEMRAGTVWRFLKQHGYV